jgi:hypothetical protein
MKNTILLPLLLILQLSAFAQVSPDDSLALVSLYEETGGTNWENDDNWLTAPVSQWNGITVIDNRIQAIRLPDNNLTGAVPNAVSTLIALEVIDLSGNALTSLPNLSTMPLLIELQVQDNELENLPNIPTNTFDSIRCENNRLEFDDLLPLAGLTTTTFTYAPQATFGESGFVYAFDGDNVSLTVSTPGTGLSYSWFFEGTLLTLPSPVPDLSLVSVSGIDEGAYVAQVTHPLLPALALESAPQTLLLYDLDSLGGAFVPNQMIIEFTDDASDFERDTLRAYFQAELLDSCLCGVIELWELPDTSYLPEGGIVVGLEETKEAAKTKSKVEDLNNNYVLPLQDQQQTHPASPTPPSGPGRGRGRNWSPKVAVIDVGIDNTHPDLEGMLTQNEAEMQNGMDDDGNCLVDDFEGYDFAEEDNQPLDPVNGHGTHIAGIITDGDPPGTLELLSIKSHQDDGLGLLFEALCGIYYARDQEAQVVNLSWGYQGLPSPVLENAIRRAGENCRTLFVASAGNDTTNNDLIPHYPSGFDLDNLISVAALDISESALADFSNYGIQTVDIAAPGTRIFSTVPGGGYDFRDGTSMAAAAVSRAAALLWKTKPEATHLDIKAALLNSATQLTELDSLASGGKLNLSAAIDMLEGMPIDSSCAQVSSQAFAMPVQHGLSMQAAPQPFGQHLNITLDSDRSQMVWLEVRSVLGQLVWQQQVNVYPGEQTVELHVPNWASGWYVLSVKSEQHNFGMQILKQ